tara:strand:- start:14 stop:2473 length:2460 start_codon:yes stop_codon:yes gene_type:complete
MANIKKSFNFRNGVQVDEDNLLVTSAGLVAIGKTVPTEALDINGNLIVSGISSFYGAQSGVLTVTTFNPTEIIGAGVSIKSGIVSSIGGGGIVTFFGDGQYLQNLPTTQFVSSNTGIALTSQNCGIGTTNATSTLQVGGFPSTHNGVGISSVGNIHASGIITATSFVGSFNGNVTTATLADAAVKLQTARTIGGLSFDGTANIDLPGVNISGNQNTSGNASGLQNNPNVTITTLTALGNANIDGNLNVIGNSVLGNNSADSLTVNAQSSFNSTITGVSGQNKIPSLYSNMGALPNPSTYHGMFAHVHSTGRGYFSHAGGWYELVNKETNGTVGTGTETYNVGGIAATSLSVGTAIPSNPIHLRSASNVELQVTSDTGIAGITVGRESGIDNVNNAEIRFGGGIGAPYSSASSFDLINYDTGNFNYHLSGNNGGSVQGDFHWHKGLNSRLMTLTNTGRLGIGETQPTTALYVSGVSTTTGGSFVGGSLSVAGSALIDNDLTVNGAFNINTINANLIGDVTGNLNGNVNAQSGISSFYQVGIQTNIIYPGLDFDGSSVNGAFFQLGVGTTQLQCAADFRDAGDTNNRFMIPPTVTTAERNTQTPNNGAFIYNSTTNKLEVYTGGTWTPLEANSGGGEVNQNAFSNIAVSGQGTLQADQKTDTVTFVAGTNVTITTDDNTDEITINSTGGGGGGSSLQSRTTSQGSTSSLASGAAVNLNMVTAKTYVLHKIQTDYAAWVTVYTDVTSRTNDASRAETTDPLPGSGVIAEVITSGATTQILTPGVIGWNNDSTPSTNTYLKVVNKESSPYPITVTLHYLKLED